MGGGGYCALRKWDLVYQSKTGVIRYFTYILPKKYPNVCESILSRLNGFIQTKNVQKPQMVV